MSNNRNSNIFVWFLVCVGAGGVIWGHYVGQNLHTGSIKVLPTRRPILRAFVLWHVWMSGFPETHVEKPPRLIWLWIHNCNLINMVSHGHLFYCEVGVRSTNVRQSFDIFDKESTKLRQRFDIFGNESTTIRHILQMIAICSTKTRPTRQWFNNDSTNIWQSDIFYKVSTKIRQMFDTYPTTILQLFEKYVTASTNIQQIWQRFDKYWTRGSL